MPTSIKSLGSAKSAGLTVNAVSKPVAVRVTTPVKTISASGGTGVGNALRDVVSTLTGGHFGQGNMQQQSGETNEQYVNRLAQAAGTAAEAFNNQVSNPSKSTSMADSFKSGVTGAAITNAITTYGPTVLVVGIAVWAAKKFVFTKKGAKRSY